MKHIFRDAPGHLPDTPANRQLLMDAVQPANKLGTDRFGVDWYAQVQTDGKQVWVSVKNGVIQNGGRNDTPRAFDPSRGLSGGGQ